MDPWDDFDFGQNFDENGISKSPPSFVADSGSPSKPDFRGFSNGTDSFTTPSKLSKPSNHQNPQMQPTEEPFQDDVDENNWPTMFPRESCLKFENNLQLSPRTEPFEAQDLNVNLKDTTDSSMESPPPSEDLDVDIDDNWLINPWKTQNSEEIDVIAEQNCLEMPEQQSHSENSQIDDETLNLDVADPSWQNVDRESESPAFLSPEGVDVDIDDSWLFNSEDSRSSSENLQSGDETLNFNDSDQHVDAPEPTTTLAINSEWNCVVPGANWLEMPETTLETQFGDETLNLDVVSADFNVMGSAPTFASHSEWNLADPGDVDVAAEQNWLEVPVTTPKTQIGDKVLSPNVIDWVDSPVMETGLNCTSPTIPLSEGVDVDADDSWLFNSESGDEAVPIEVANADSSGIDSASEVDIDSSTKDIEPEDVDVSAERNWIEMPETPLSRDDRRFSEDLDVGDETLNPDVGNDVVSEMTPTLAFDSGPTVLPSEGVDVDNSWLLNSEAGQNFGTGDPALNFDVSNALDTITTWNHISSEDVDVAAEQNWFETPETPLSTRVDYGSLKKSQFGNPALNFVVVNPNLDAMVPPSMLDTDSNWNHVYTVLSENQIDLEVENATQVPRESHFSTTLPSEDLNVDDSWLFESSEEPIDLDIEPKSSESVQYEGAPELTLGYVDDADEDVIGEQSWLDISKKRFSDGIEHAHSEDLQIDDEVFGSSSESAMDTTSSWIHVLPGHCERNFLSELPGDVHVEQSRLEQQFEVENPRLELNPSSPFFNVTSADPEVTQPPLTFPGEADLSLICRAPSPVDKIPENPMPMPSHDRNAESQSEADHLVVNVADHEIDPSPMLTGTSGSSESTPPDQNRNSPAAEQMTIGGEIQEASSIPDAPDPVLEDPLVVGVDSEETPPQTHRNRPIFIQKWLMSSENKKIHMLPVNLQRPPFTLSALSAFAIRNSPTQWASHHEICCFILHHFRYFRYIGEHWKSSVRYGLIRHPELFVSRKVPGDEGQSEMTYWKTRDDFDFRLVMKNKEIKFMDSGESRPSSFFDRMLRGELGLPRQLFYHAIAFHMPFFAGPENSALFYHLLALKQVPDTFEPLFREHWLDEHPGIEPWFVEPRIDFHYRHAVLLEDRDQFGAALADDEPVKMTRRQMVAFLDNADAYFGLQRQSRAIGDATWRTPKLVDVERVLSAVPPKSYSIPREVDKLPLGSVYRADVDDDCSEPILYTDVFPTDATKTDPPEMFRIGAKPPNPNPKKKKKRARVVEDVLAPYCQSDEEQCPEPSSSTEARDDGKAPTKKRKFVDPSVVSLW